MVLFCILLLRVVRPLLLLPLDELAEVEEAALNFCLILAQLLEMGPFLSIISVDIYSKVLMVTCKR